MKKLLLLATFLLGTLSANAAIPDTIRGTCGAQGDNLTWMLTPDSILVISGKGAMKITTNTIHLPLGTATRRV